MTDTPPILTSRTIGETENALRAILLRALRETDLDYHRWVALKLVSESQPPVSRASALDRLQLGLKIDGPTADKVIEFLEINGIVTDGKVLSLTPDGSSLYRRLDDEIRRIADRLWTGLDTEDLATAHHVLTTIAERANSVLAS